MLFQILYKDILVKLKMKQENPLINSIDRRIDR